MTEPVSIRDCARYLAVGRESVMEAIKAGVPRYGIGAGKVVPKDVFEALVANGTLTQCPCCASVFERSLPTEEP